MAHDYQQPKLPFDAGIELPKSREYLACRCGCRRVVLSVKRFRNGQDGTEATCERCGSFVKWLTDIELRDMKQAESGDGRNLR